MKLAAIPFKFQLYKFYDPGLISVSPDIIKVILVKGKKVKICKKKLY